jgi:hypothetical protein
VLAALVDLHERQMMVDHDIHPQTNREPEHRVFTNLALRTVLYILIVPNFGLDD